MRTMFKPSKIAAVLLAVIVATAMYVATSLFIDGAKDADLIVISYGSFFLVLAAMFSRIAFEGLSTRIRMGGIEQIFLLIPQVGLAGTKTAGQLVLDGAAGDKCGCGP